VRRAIGAFGKPRLGVTFDGGDGALLERLLPLVDVLEVTPDTVARFNNGEPMFSDDTIAILRNASRHVAIVVHGIGLSIGSYDGMSDTYLRMLDRFLAQVDVEWHSEHVGYTHVDGDFLGTMLAVPKTADTLDMLSERVLAIRRRYDLPFLLENIAHLLPSSDDPFSEAGFLNELCDRTGCALIVDVHNIECDAHNYGFDVDAFCRELQWSHVRELHLAGGVERDGFLMDVHSNPTRDRTLTIAADLIRRYDVGSIEVVTYELLREAVPILGEDAIVREIERLRVWLDGVTREPRASSA
jgi:uncharacterized protein (UPF0276 family)